MTDAEYLKGLADAEPRLLQGDSASLKTIAYRLAYLETVVAKLPKTADGMPVVPGMKVYQRDPVGYIQSYDVGTNRASDDSSCPSPAYLVFNHRCYSTRKAAEQAEEGGE